MLTPAATRSSRLPSVSRLAPALRPRPRLAAPLLRQPQCAAPLPRLLPREALLLPDLSDRRYALQTDPTQDPDRLVDTWDQGSPRLVRGLPRLAQVLHPRAAALRRLAQASRRPVLPADTTTVRLLSSVYLQMACRQMACLRRAARLCHHRATTRACRPARAVAP